MGATRGRPSQSASGKQTVSPGLGGLFNRSIGLAMPNTTVGRPSISPTSGQDNLGVDILKEPFGGVRGTSSMSPKRDSSAFGLQNVDEPTTRVGLTPDSSDEKEDDITVKSPGIREDDEEKRREAVEKAEEFKIRVSGI